SKIASANRTRLVLVGPGNSRPYQILARSLNLDESIVFAGRVEESTLNAAYSLAAALVHPAAIAGSGLAIEDAVASGIAVVSDSEGGAIQPNPATAAASVCTR